MSDPIFDISSWDTPDQQQEVDPWATHNDLTPSVQQGYSQLLPTLLKKVLEDDDSDLGMYTPQGYFIPRGKASKEKRAAQRAQALEMMKGLMGQLNESTSMGGSGKGGKNGLLNGMKLLTPGSKLLWGDGQIDPATGMPNVKELASAEFGVKAINGQAVNGRTGNMMNDLRTTPEETANLETAKSGPDYILKKTEEIRNEEQTAFSNYRESRQIWESLKDPDVGQYFGPGGDLKATAAGLASTMFPGDDPNEALSKADQVLGRMYKEGLASLKGLSPVTDADLDIALRSIAGNRALTPAGIRALAKATMERSRAVYKQTGERRQGLKALPHQNADIHNVNPRYEELPPDPAEFNPQPAQGMQPVPVQQISGAQAPAKPMSAAEWAMKTGRLSAPQQTRIQPQNLDPRTPTVVQPIPNIWSNDRTIYQPLPNQPDNSSVVLDNM
jgi:hypothetical protein